MTLLTSIVSSGIFLFIVGGMALIALLLRVVVSTNEVHIVQSSKHTISYGKDQAAGNSYYKWPAWLPRIGITVSRLPVSVFNVTLSDYAAYDKGRVPFMIDITAFFRINDSNIAAQRVNTTDELRQQLNSILQGACRSILASSEIEEILEGRSKFSQMFTDAVENQLKEWGLTNVKNIELMDIRDAQGSQVIGNIMAKKKSLIEKESRVAVAENKRAGAEAEIIANREVGIRQQEAEEQVGVRAAAKEQAVGIAKQKSEQQVQTEAALTTSKQMDVLKTQRIRTAEIDRDQRIVEAERDKRSTVIMAEGQAAANVAVAEGERQRISTIAQGNLEQSLRHADGVRAEGVAVAAAEQARQLASVTAQTTLAHEIGENLSYQQYLLSLRNIEAQQAIGIQQAEALKAAQIKVIATGGNVTGGVNNALDLFSAAGGSRLGAMVEAFAQTDSGAAILKRAAPTAPNGAGH